MRTVVIIQARMGSTRLPGKVAMLLDGKSVLAHVIERAKMIPGIDQVVAAFPASEQSKTLCQIAQRCCVPWFLGSHDNVLMRYFDCATEHHADVIVRITADCPLLDPVISGHVVRLRHERTAEYASNVWPRSFPQGLDTEVFTYAALKRAYERDESDYDREHVTPYMIRNAMRVNYPSGRFDLARHRWTLDYYSDLLFLRKIFAIGSPSSMDETLQIIQDHDIELLREAS